MVTPHPSIKMLRPIIAVTPPRGKQWTCKDCGALCTTKSACGTCGMKRSYAEVATRTLQAAVTLPAPSSSCIQPPPFLSTTHSYERLILALAYFSYLSCISCTNTKSSISSPDSSLAMGILMVVFQTGLC